MKKKSLEIVALAILSSLLVSAKLVPVKAAPSNTKATKENKADSEKKLGDTKLFEDTPLFESKKFKIAFITSLSMTGLAILVGTGRSIKYNQSKQEHIEPEKDIINLDTPAQTTKSESSKENNKVERSLKASKPTAISQLESIDDPQTNYRKIYQDLQEFVYQSPHFADNPSWEADSWEVDVEIAIKILSEWPGEFERVKLVLSESDRVREYKKNLPLAKYQTQTNEYIEKAYNWAEELQQWRKEKTNSEELSSTNSIYN